MSFSHQNGKTNLAYEQGYKEFYEMIHSKLVKTPWRHLGVFSFYDAPYLDSEKIYLSAKEVLLAIAAEIKTRQNSLIFVVDATNYSDIESHAKSDFQRFLRLFRYVFPKSKVQYFGPKDTERVWLHEFESTKIPLEWLIKRPDMFARAITDLSLLGERLGPADVSFEDISEMKEVMIEKLGPPSLTGEVLSRFRDADAVKYTDEAVGLATAIINPAVAVSRGVRYLGKFVSLVRRRRQKEIKELHTEWRQKVESAYSEKNLTKFIDTSPTPESKLIRAQFGSNPVLLLIETRGTLYDVFMPLVLYHLIEEVGYKPQVKRVEVEVEEYELDSDIEAILDEELDASDNRDAKTDFETRRQAFENKPGVQIFMDFGTHLSNFRTSFQYMLKVPDKYSNISLSASFYTDHGRVKEILSDAVHKFINTRAIVFDLHPILFDLITTNTPITTKAWLQNCLRKMKAAQSNNTIAFLEYNGLEPNQWKMRPADKSQKGLLGRIRRYFKSD